MRRHAPSIGIGIGISLRSTRPSGIDPDVLAFAAESGATDLAGLNSLVKYLKGEGLYDNFVIYPMKSAQNAGSGSTLFGLGGLTANNMALANAPSWDTTGISYDGVDQYASDADFLGSNTLLTFTRMNLSVATSNASAILSQYDTGANDRGFLTAWSGSGAETLSMNRSSTGGSVPNLEVYQSSTTDVRGSDHTVVSKWVSGGARFLWVDKTSESISLVGGFDAQTVRFNSSAPIAFAARLNSGAPEGFATVLGVAAAFCNTDVTLSQRETITDKVNAL